MLSINSTIVDITNDKLKNIDLSYRYVNITDTCKQILITFKMPNNQLTGASRWYCSSGEHMLQIYHSNQLEIHKELISSLIKSDPLTNPFEQEIILVQSPGMSQWLQIELAQSLGIAANISFPLPATFIWDMFTRVLPDIPKESAFSKGAMTWKLMTILPSLLHESEFEPLRQYLNEDMGKRKLYQLSGRIADLFDQYLVYRPQWLENWHKNN